MLFGDRSMAPPAPSHGRPRGFPGAASRGGAAAVAALPAPPRAAAPIAGSARTGGSSLSALSRSSTGVARVAASRCWCAERQFVRPARPPVRSQLRRCRRDNLAGITLTAHRDRLGGRRAAQPVPLTAGPNHRAATCTSSSGLASMGLPAGVFAGSWTICPKVQQARGSSRKSTPRAPRAMRRTAWPALITREPVRGAPLHR